MNQRDKLKRLQTITIIVVLQLVYLQSSFSSLFSINVSGEQGGPIGSGEYYVILGDWVIEAGDDITYSNCVIEANGNITVEAGGRLTFYNVTLEINSLNPADPLKFIIEDGGEFYAYESNITELFSAEDDGVHPNDPRYYKFEVYGTMELIDTEVSYMWGDINGFMTPIGGFYIVTPLGGIQLYSDDVYISGCTIFKGHTSGIYIYNCSPIIVNNIVTANVGYGISTIGGSPELIDNIISNNGFDGAIFIDVSSPTTIFTNNYIVNNDWMGVVISTGSDIVCEYNEIIDNDWGIWCVDSTVTLRNNIITGNEGLGIYAWSAEGLIVQDSQISGCTDQNMGYAILCRNSSGIVIEECTISDNRYGLYALNSHSIVVDDTVFSNNNVSVYLDNSTSTIINSTITGSTLYGLELLETPNVHLLNTTGDWITKFHDANSSLWRNWYLHVKVIDEAGNPLPDASVIVCDTYGTEIFNGSSGSTGRVNWLVCPEYWMNWSTTIHYDPYSVYVSKCGVYTNVTLMLPTSLETCLMLVNYPPVAIITAPIEDAEYLHNETIWFDATASYDPDPTDVLSYYWHSDIMGGIGYVSSFNRTLVPGEHLITLYVADNTWHNVSATVNITVIPPNHPPVADAGVDQEVKVNETVYFDASASYDPDGDAIVAYSWAFGDNTTATGIAPTHVYTIAGCYEVVLTVTDAHGATDTDSCNITVIENNMPVAIATVDKNLTNVNEAVVFDASESYDPDDDPLTYFWNFDDGTTATAMIVTHSYSMHGDYNVTLTVEDGYGGTATDHIHILVNQLPYADAGPDMEVYEEELVTFNGTSWDLDGEITLEEWDFNNDTVWDWNSTLDIEPVFVYTVPCTYVATYRVWDDAGAYATDYCNVTVLPLGPPPPPPSENLPPTIQIDTPAEGALVMGTVTVAGYASDPNNDTLTIFVAIDDGPWENATVSIANNTDNGTYRWLYEWDTTTVANGLHTIHARAFDGELDAITIVNVTVDNPIEYYYGVDLECIDNAHEIPPGATTQYNITVRNTGNVADTIEFVLRAVNDQPGIEDWAFALDTTTITLEPNTTTIIYLFVTAPTTLEPELSTAIVEVMGVSCGDPSIMDSITTTTTVILPNRPPTVTIISPVDGAIVAGEITIEGIASDPDGDDTLQKVEIKIGSMPDDYWLLASGTTTWTYVWDTTLIENGVYKLSARSYDGVLYSDIMTITVEVANPLPNQVPIANAGSDMLVNVNTTVQFNGTGSYDPDDDINGNGKIDAFETDNLTYYWEFGDNTTGLGPTPSHKYTEPGTYRVELTVTDPRGANATDTITVEVNALPIAIFVVTPQVARVNDIIKFNASGSYDPDNDSLHFIWDFGDGSPPCFDMICTHAYAYPGEYEVVLIVNDTRGGSANASCIVTIREKEAPVQPPVPIRLAPPRITAPEDGAIVAGEVKIRGTAIATNDTGIIQQVDIRIGTEDADWLPAVDTSPTGNWSTWEYLWDTTKVPNGKYMIAARAFDGMNYSAITTINVTVFNRPVVTDEDYEEYEEGAEPSWWQRVIDAILANRIYLVGAFAVIILIVGLAVGFVVYKRRKRAKIPRVVGVPVPEQLLKPIPKRKLVPEKLLKPIVKVKRKLVQVRCPRCTKVFEIEDYGKRPLRMKCTRCGVRGMIRALPAELEEAERLKPIKKKKPKPPSPEIVTKRIKCPACTNVFTSELEAEGELVKCPECGRFGLI